MDFKLQMGRLLVILGVYLSICLSMWPSVVMCITMGNLFHVWGGVAVGLSIICFLLNNGHITSCCNLIG